MRPKKLYHGSNIDAHTICREGLKPPLLIGGSDCYIYTSLSPDEAQKWGETVWEISVARTDDLRVFHEENPTWQILINNAIPPDRLTVYFNKEGR